MSTGTIIKVVAAILVVATLAPVAGLIGNVVAFKIALLAGLI
jgi:hypothetical protein